MTKHQRRVIYDGYLHQVECAVDARGDSPATVFLEKLQSGVTDTRFAENGEFIGRAGSYNQLREGIWELKHGKYRLSFHDTDGIGSIEPKIVFEHGILGLPPFLPDFDEYIRVGHCFTKPLSQRKTSEFDISETLRIRDEDVRHDGR